MEFWSWKRMAALVAVGVVVGVGFADPAEAGTRLTDPPLPSAVTTSTLLTV